MFNLSRRHAAIGTLTLMLGLAAIVTGLGAPSRTAQAQPTSLMAQQPPASCVCAPAVAVFGGSSGGPQIAHCQCGALNCAAATSAGGVSLQCAR